MSVVNTFFGLVVLLVSFIPAVARTGDPQIEWYESFFQGKQQPAEQRLHQLTERLREEQEILDLAAEAKTLKEIGLIHLTRTHNYELAMDHFIRSLAIEDSLKLQAEQVFTHLAIAHVFEVTGDHYKSTGFLERALELNRPSNNVHVLVYILNKLGKVNTMTGRVEEAFENFKMVLHYKDQVGDAGTEADALFNLANLYVQQLQYDSALHYHKQGLALRRQQGDRRNEAQSLNDIGEVYRLMKNHDKALANHVVALEIRQSLKDKNGVAESYNNIGALYYHQKNYERAIANLRLGLEAAHESQSQHKIAQSYELLSACYRALGDFKQALEYKELALAINDLIVNERNEQHVAEKQSLYEIGKKEIQIGKLESIRKQRELELQEQRRFRNFLFIVMGLGVVIALLILYLYLMKRRSNKVMEVAHKKVNEQNVQLQELNATKDKFFSIISHDLKGPLNSLTSFSGLLINHTDSLSKEEIRMLAQDLDKSLKNLFALLENLLEWSRSQTGNIEFKPETFDLSEVLHENQALLQAQAQSKNISLVFHKNGAVVTQAHKNSVNTVVRNLISNAIKFTPPGGTITLDAQPGEKEIKVSVADTGVGMSEEVVQKLFRIDTKHSTRGTADEKGTGLGLILCKEFIEKNGGTIGVNSQPGKGSVFYFVLPRL